MHRLRHPADLSQDKSHVRFKLFK